MNMNTALNIVKMFLACFLNSDLEMEQILSNIIGLIFSWLVFIYRVNTTFTVSHFIFQQFEALVIIADKDGWGGPCTTDQETTYLVSPSVTRPPHNESGP